MSRVRLIAGGDDGGKPLDIFELVELQNGVAKVRTAYLFELGEEMKIRVEEDGAIFEATARVRAHLGTGANTITELELGEKTAVS